MKKLFLFITILLASYNLGAQEDFHLEGAISKSYGYLSLTTAERDALGLGLNDRKTIWNSTDDELQYWTGISWVCISCSATTTLEEAIAADPIAMSLPVFKGGAIFGYNDGTPAIITLSGGAAGSANLTIASTVAGAVLAHSAGISFTAQSLIVNGDPVSHFYENGYNASTDDLSLSDGDSNPNGWETFVTVAGSHDFGSGAISLGVNDVIQKINGVYRKKVDNNQSGGSVVPPNTRLDATISGSTNVDWSSNSVFVYTLSGATTLVDQNLPSGTNTQVIEMVITGDETLTFPAYYTALSSNDVYDGTGLNHIVISCINGNGGSELVIYTLTNL